MAKKRKHDQIQDQDDSSITIGQPDKNENSRSLAATVPSTPQTQLGQEKAERKSKKQKRSKEQAIKDEQSISHDAEISAPVSSKSKSQLKLEKSEKRSKEEDQGRRQRRRPTY